MADDLIFRDFALKVMATVCNGICHRYRAKLPQGGKRYELGFKFCSFCQE